MEENTIRQLLGLGRTSSDTAFIRKHSIVRSAWTELDPLCLALAYAHHFGLTNVTLCCKYGLRPNTLSEIDHGHTLQRNRSLYMNCMMRALNDLRLQAIVKGDELLCNSIVQVLSELALVMVGLATDSELVEQEIHFPYR